MLKNMDALLAGRPRTFASAEVAALDTMIVAADKPKARLSSSCSVPVAIEWGVTSADHYAA